MSTPCQSETMGIDPGALVTITEEILVRLRALYAEYGVPLPSRCYWTLGDPAVDCEQAVVSFQSYEEHDLSAQQTNATPNPCAVLTKATFTISITRCAPALSKYGDPPTPKQIMDTAKLCLVDAHLLMKGSCRFDMYGADIPGAITWGWGANASVQGAAPHGDFRTTTLQFTTILG